MEAVFARHWWTGFGTNFILREAVLKRSTSMSSDPLAFFVLPKRYLRKGVCFQLASDYTGTERRTHRHRIPKQISKIRADQAFVPPSTVKFAPVM